VLRRPVLIDGDLDLGNAIRCKLGDGALHAALVDLDLEVEHDASALLRGGDVLHIRAVLGDVVDTMTVATQGAGELVVGNVVDEVLDVVARRISAHCGG
jgi:hypothetical protein